MKGQRQKKIYVEESWFFFKKRSRKCRGAFLTRRELKGILSTRSLCFWVGFPFLRWRKSMRCKEQTQQLIQLLRVNLTVRTKLMYIYIYIQMVFIVHCLKRFAAWNNGFMSAVAFCGLVNNCCLLVWQLVLSVNVVRKTFTTCWYHLECVHFCLWCTKWAKPMTPSICGLKAADVGMNSLTQMWGTLIVVHVAITVSDCNCFSPGWSCQ